MSAEETLVVGVENIEYYPLYNWDGEEFSGYARDDKSSVFAAEGKHIPEGATEEEFDIEAFTEKHDLLSVQNEITYEDNVLGDCVLMYTHQQLYSQFRRQMVLGLAEALLIGLVIIVITNVFLYRKIISPLSGISSRFSRASKGDLTGDFTAGGRDEIGLLSSSIQTFIGITNRLLQNLRNSSSDIANISQQIYQSAETFYTESESQAENREYFLQSLQKFVDGLETLRGDLGTQNENIGTIDDKVAPEPVGNERQLLLYKGLAAHVIAAGNNDTIHIAGIYDKEMKFFRVVYVFTDRILRNQIMMRSEWEKL